MPREKLNLEDILTDKLVEDELLHVPLAQNIFRFFLLSAFAVGAIILIQLLNIGLFEYEFYTARATLNASDVKVEPAPRGVIFDRFGEPLVRNEPSFNAFLVPRVLPKEGAAREDVFGKIGAVLNISGEDLAKKIAAKDWSLNDELLLNDNLSHDELVALLAEEMPGLKLEPTFKRIPEPSFKMAHLLGYAGLVNEEDLKADKSLGVQDVIGRTGLEEYYDRFLRGQNGKEVFLKDARGQIKDKKDSVPPVAGNSLDTFIDKDFQSYFYDELQAALRNLGRDIGLGIALNPQNGEVLALFSIPSYDSANVGDYLSKADYPLFNRTVSGLYNPGSTIKPLVATAALAEGVIDPKETIYSPGFLDVPNPYDPSSPNRFLDWRPQGWVDIRSALARSSNVYFYEVGGGLPAQAGLGGQIGLGISRLREWWGRFLLDRKTGIDLTGEESGFLPSPEWKESRTGQPWLLGDTYNVSIGQGDLLVTPIELLNYVSAIANGGKFYEPRIMKDIKDEKRNVVLKSEPTLIADISPVIGGVLSDVRQGMRDAVTKPYGTANLLSDLPFAVAAKTGSAQTNNNAKVNALFVGYAPFDDPQIAVVVLVENAREGSLNAVPVAKNVLLWYYNHRIKS